MINSNKWEDKKLKKKFKLLDGNLSIEIDNDSYVPFISIKKAYINDAGLQKIVTFSMWDDFQFDAYSKNSDIELLFEFKKDDYLYPNLSILLGEDKQIIIDDDNTLDRLKKFMSITRKGESIIIIFHGNVGSKFIHQKYSVFIKNIGPDSRSKIQNLDLKTRLIDFFENCKNSLFQKENQFLEGANGRTKIKNKCIRSEYYER